MNNGDVVVHTTYGKFVYMLFGQNKFVHTTYRELFYMSYGLNPFYIQQHIGKCPYTVWKKSFFHTTYGKCVYMLYGEVFYM